MTVYKITNKQDKILYVGLTSDLNRRMSEHRNCVKNMGGKDNTQVYLYTQLALEDELKFTEVVSGDSVSVNTEKYWIKKLHPKYNTIHNKAQQREWVPMTIQVENTAKMIEEDQFINNYISQNV